MLDDIPEHPLSKDLFLQKEITVRIVWQKSMIWVSRSPTQGSVKTTMMMKDYIKFNSIDFVNQPIEQVKETIRSILDVNK